MPNAMQRCKTNPLIKEKEKMNAENGLRRQPNGLQSTNQRERPASTTIRHLPPQSLPPLSTPVHHVKAEPFWERLSKVKRDLSQSNVTEFGTGSHLNLLHGSSQSRIPPMRSSVPQQKPYRKPIVAPYTIPRAITEPKKTARKTQVNKDSPLLAVPEAAQKLYLTKPPLALKEILAVRPATNSVTSSEGYAYKPMKKASSITPEEISSTGSHYYSPRTGLSHNTVCPKDISALDDYKMPPLIRVPTTDSLSSSVMIRNDFKNLLEQRNCSMEPDQISLVKKVVKDDERHRQLQPKDSKLFKSILESQLKQILKEELAVKEALTKLNGSAFSSSLPGSEENSVDKSIMTRASRDGLEISDPGNRKVSIVFNNVPTLEKEIIILKALGERLEASLQRRASSAVGGNVGMREVSHYVIGVVHRAEVVVRPIGLRYERSYVKEFRIARKTIVELKENASKHFYLVDDANKEMRRTSFRKLKENPDVLMRHLKPKSALVPFNVLDQDPMFFNSFLNKIIPGQPTPPPPKHFDEESCVQDLSDENSSEGVSIREGGDSTIYRQHRLRAKLKEDKKRVLWEEDEPVESKKPSYGLMQQRLRKIKEKELKIWEVGSEEFQDDNPEESSSKEIKTTDYQAIGKVTKNPSTNQSQSKRSKSKDNCKKKKPLGAESGDGGKEPPKLSPDAESEKSKNKASKRSESKSFVKPEENPHSTVLFEAPLRGKDRRRIRRSFTPMGMEKEIEPKNNILTTLLVGFAQIAVFLVLIVAVTYPDLRCF